MPLRHLSQLWLSYLPYWKALAFLPFDDDAVSSLIVTKKTLIFLIELIILNANNAPLGRKPVEIARDGVPSIMTAIMMVVRRSGA
jgi:hypothetical protein